MQHRPYPSTAICLTVFGCFIFFNALKVQAENLYLLDSKRPAFIIVDGETGEKTATIKLTGEPEMMLQTGTGAFLILDKPDGQSTGRGQYKPKTRSTMTIVHPSAARATPKVTLGWGVYSPIWTYHPRKTLHREAHWNPAAIAFTRENSVAVISPGFWSKKAKKTKKGLLQLIDLSTGAVLDELPLEQRPYHFVASPDGKHAAILFANQMLLLSLLPEISVIKSLPYRHDSGEISQFSGAGDFLYLVEALALDPDSKQREVPLSDGQLRVISMSGDDVRSFPVERGPWRFVQDPVSTDVFLFSNNPPVGGQGRGSLRLLRNGNITATFETGHSGSAIRQIADTQTRVVMSNNLLQIIDLAKLELQASIPIDGQVAEFITSGDKRRAIILQKPSAQVSVIDLNTRHRIADITTWSEDDQRKQERDIAFAEAMSQSSAQSLAMGVSQQFGGDSAVYSTFYSAFSQMYGVGMQGDPGQPSSANLIISRDGKVAYAFNATAGRLYIIDVENGTVIEQMEKLDGVQLMLLNQEKTLLLYSRATLTFLDTATRQKRSFKHLTKEKQVDFYRFWDAQQGITTSRDGRLLYIPSRKWLAAMNTKTLDIVYRTEGFQNIQQFWRAHE